MKLSEISIKRPVLATVMSLAIVLFGIISFTQLPVREYPEGGGAAGDPGCAAQPLHAAGGHIRPARGATGVGHLHRPDLRQHHRRQCADRA